MNTELLVNQLVVAILSSAIAIPLVQRFKDFLPSEKAVEIFSILSAFLVGTGFAVYYAQFELVSALIVGAFSVIGAETIYKLLGEKVKGYVGNPHGFEPEIIDEESVG